MRGFGFSCGASVVAEVPADVFLELSNQSVTEVVGSASRGDKEENASFASIAQLKTDCRIWLLRNL